MVKSAAVFTVIAASKMTPKGRRDIAKWLRHQAEMLVAEGKKYSSSRFTARYLYEERA